VQYDRSSIALKFVKPPADDSESGDAESSTDAAQETSDRQARQAESVPNQGTVKYREQNYILIENTDFCIPPHQPAFPVTAWYTFLNDATLYALHGHMHLRGKSMLFTAHYPDGTQEILLEIANWDYDWELVYSLKQPKEMPRGTRLEVVAVFDNSSGNLRNEDPEAHIIVGRGYHNEEMMSGGITFVEHDTGLFDGTDTRLWESSQWNRKLSGNVAKLLQGYVPLDKVAPDKRSVYFHQRGLYRERFEDRSGAIEDYSAAIAQDARFVPAYVSRAQAHIVLGDRQTAMADLNAALHWDPMHVPAWIARGKLQTSLELALADFDRAVKLDPLHVDAYYERAAALRDAGDLAAALREYTNILEQVHPGHVSSYIDRGAIRLRTGDEAGAEKDFAFVIEKWPTRMTEIDYARGKVLADLGRHAEAVENLKRVQSIIHQDSHLARALAVSQASIGKFQDALENAKLAGEISPTDNEPPFMAGKLLVLMANAEANPANRAARLTEALSQFEESLRRKSDEPQVLAEAAGVCQRLGRYADAGGFYERTIELNPNNTGTLTAYALLLATCEDDAIRNGTRSLALAQQACRITEHREISSLEALAAAFAELGQFQDAVRVAAEAADVARGAGQLPRAQLIGTQQRRYQNQQPLRISRTP